MKEVIEMAEKELQLKNQEIELAEEAKNADLRNAMLNQQKIDRLTIIRDNFLHDVADLRRWYDHNNDNDNDFDSQPRQAYAPAKKEPSKPRMRNED